MSDAKFIGIVILCVIVPLASIAAAIIHTESERDFDGRCIRAGGVPYTVNRGVVGVCIRRESLIELPEKEKPCVT
jgi:hypothetical protein